jgi:hypothetical protein
MVGYPSMTEKKTDDEARRQAASILVMARWSRTGPAERRKVGRMLADARRRKKQEREAAKIG